MGLNGLSENIAQKILYSLTTLIPSTNPLHSVTKVRILLYVALQLSAFGATFAIAVGFPIIILLLTPLRTLVVP